MALATDRDFLIRLVVLSLCLGRNTPLLDCRYVKAHRLNDGRRSPGARCVSRARFGELVESAESWCAAVRATVASGRGGRGSGFEHNAETRLDALVEAGRLFL